MTYEVDNFGIVAHGAKKRQNPRFLQTFFGTTAESFHQVLLVVIYDARQVQKRV